MLCFSLIICFISLVHAEVERSFCYECLPGEIYYCVIFGDPPGATGAWHCYTPNPYQCMESGFCRIPD